MPIIMKFRNRQILIIDFLLLLLTPVIALSLRVNLPWGREYVPALLGVSKLDFIHLLARHGIAYFSESPDELAAGAAVLEQM